VVIDPRDYPLNGIDDAFRWIPETTGPLFPAAPGCRGKIQPSLPTSSASTASLRVDERVERFAEKITDHLVVIDPRDYPLNGIDDAFRPSPFTRNNGTSFSSSSRVPWKNSAELTDFVRFHFAEKITDHLVVIDPRDYPLNGIDDAFRWIMAPCVVPPWARFSNQTAGNNGGYSGRGRYGAQSGPPAGPIWW
jgi:hypothetical protein